MSTKAIVCRCEDTTLDDVRHAIELGYRDIEEIKRYTGLGTGPCGGKECMSLCASVIARAAGVTPTPPGAHVGTPFTARPPLQTVSLRTLAHLTDGND